MTIPEDQIFTSMVVLMKVNKFDDKRRGGLIDLWKAYL